MELIRIEGPSRLEGTVKIQGSKNATLPIMAASVINGGTTVLENYPDISDISMSVSILRSIGCTVQHKFGKMIINSSQITSSHIPNDKMCRLRSSFLFSGALLARCGKVICTYPGGCNIGSRPIDIHLDAFKKFGVKVDLHDSVIECRAEKLKAADVVLRFPSVGATENIMLLASAAKGTTRIYGAACEPEITDLQNFLCRMGVDVSGGGTSVVIVTGTKEFKNVNYRVMPDRIDAATFIAAVGCAGGEIELDDANLRYISSFAAAMRKCGMKIHQIKKDRLLAVRDGRLRGGINIRTNPYPGFATDMQSLIVAVLCLSDGVSTVSENIFENRFCMCDALKKMGADVNVCGKTACIKGVEHLIASDADACDLRSGAALAAAMLAADGVSYLGGVNFIDRGYEDFVPRLVKIGAKAERIEID